MAALTRLTLEHNGRTERWDLRYVRSRRLLKSFATKRAATRRGVLRRVAGHAGASVVIHRVNGRFHEERTYPPSRDPHRSRG